MGLFGSRRPSRRIPADDDDSLDHQGMGIELIDAFTDHDETGLATLSPAQLAEQVSAREALHGYLDRMWDDAKARGLNPAIRPEWSVVAGLLDLSNNLLQRALDLQLAAEDGADQ